MKHFNQLHISQPLITVFCSGNSINDIPQEDIDYIKSKSFLITVNYAPIKIKGNLNIHSDKKVTDFLKKYFKETGGKQGLLLLSRERAFNNQNQVFKNSIDYWFDEKKEHLIGNYTVVWLFQLLERTYPDKKIMVFGLDMYINNDTAKWYDSVTSFDRDRRGAKYPVQIKLNQCAKQLNANIKNKDLFINCNPNSGYDSFKKVDNWKELYEKHTS
jgi:hypothetical protein